MADFYVMSIRLGLKTIEQVPDSLKELVEKALAKAASAEGKSFIYI